MAAKDLGDHLGDLFGIIWGISWGSSGGSLGDHLGDLYLKIIANMATQMAEYRHFILKINVAIVPNTHPKFSLRSWLPC